MLQTLHVNILEILNNKYNNVYIHEQGVSYMELSACIGGLPVIKQNTMNPIREELKLCKM